MVSEEGKELALKDIEGQLGTSVVSEQNYLNQPKQKQIEQSSLFDELREE